MNKKTEEMRALKVMDIYEEKEKFMKHIKNELKNMKICLNENSTKVYEYYHNEKSI